MDLNIRPRKNTYTNLTQPRQPRSKREARDRGYQTPVIDNNINTPIIEQTTVIEPENNSNVTTSTYTAINSRTAEKIEFNLEDRRAMTRKMNISFLELQDLIQGNINSIKGWTILVNTNKDVNGSTPFTKNSENTVYSGTLSRLQKTNNINSINEKISIEAINLKTNITINFESVSQAAQTLDISKTGISLCINNKRDRIGNWKFSKFEEEK